MRVLITGSTSSQSSQKTFSRTPTFAGLLAENLSKSGAEVEFSRPYLEWDKDFLKRFDAVLVGIAPLTSVAANNLYPALSTASKAEKLKKLSLFVDAPEPQKIHASLASFEKGNVDLFKVFYENRREYERVSEDPRLMREIEVFCQRMFLSEWPLTLYPWTPWVPLGQVEKHLPKISAGGLLGVSIDSYLLDEEKSVRSQRGEGANYWCYDNNKTKWFRGVERSLRYEAFSMKENQFSGREVVSQRISGGLGSLMTTYRSNELWWSPILSTSLNLGVPVVSDWRVTNSAGLDWNHLPSTVEEMSSSERFSLATAQRESYIQMLDFKDDVNQIVLSALTK